MAFKNYREESRKDWGTESAGVLDREQIKLGAILRIADAVEKMAEEYSAIIRARNFYKDQSERLRSELDKARRSNAGLRGYITSRRGK